MRRLFLGNFEFENQLAGDSQAARNSAVSRITSELSSAWQAVAQDDDAVWMSEIPDDDFPSEMADQGFLKVGWIHSLDQLQRFVRESPLDLCPWGWSQDAMQWAERIGVSCDPPTFAAVRAANSRRFSFGLERELKMGLEGSAELSSLPDCQQWLWACATDARWVIKSEFGMSARERILGRGRELSSQQEAWIAKRFKAGLKLYFEPWADSLGEAGLQFDVPRLGAAEPRCIGIAPMLTDDSGAYRGSRFDPPGNSLLDWTGALEAGLLAASRAQTLGYHGPLGIDAMWYLDRDQIPRLRPLQDINARWTMGRLSLGFRSRLAPGDVGAWVHLRCSAQTLDTAREWWRQLKSDLPHGVQLLRTSPLTLGGKAVRHATAVLISPDEESLCFAIELVLSVR